MYKGEKEVAEYLSKARKASIEQIAVALDMNVDSVRRIVEALRANGYVVVETAQKEQLNLTKDAEKCLREKRTPEYSVFGKIGVAVQDLSDEEKKFGIRMAKIKGFIDIEGGKIVSRKDRQFVEAELAETLKCLSDVASEKPAVSKEKLEELLMRKFVLRSVQKTALVSPTDKKLEGREGEFDISIEARPAELGKSHPLTKLMKKIKLVFVGLGFEEMDGEFVESAFWNFDALFQPQDHPARDLADTFYLKGEASLPQADLVKRIKTAHEKSWKYGWKESEAKKLVLRTHTTALSARKLASINGNVPGKYFALGRVFRNEATDYSHLAEFHQVEGIISWEGATFRDLLGILKEFYKKLGFEKVRFRPSYFPYTEPSLEVEIYYEPKKTWLEIGGAGIMRPEVSIPLGNRYPVLAWGLSLERPAMLLLGVGDIRTFYKNDLNFLKSAVLKV